jgi:hypothetical protein
MSKKPQVGDRVDVQFAINAKGRFWWFIVPHGVEPLTAVRADPPHGPFASEAEAQANFEVTVLGEQCDVRDGGDWDPKWGEKQ